eukprot:COSAG01_NODE_3090_length_6601_cov_5.372347_1_plen_117_part_10
MELRNASTSFSSTSDAAILAAALLAAAAAMVFFPALLFIPDSSVANFSGTTAPAPATARPRCRLLLLLLLPAISDSDQSSPSIQQLRHHHRGWQSPGCRSQPLHHILRRRALWLTGA